MEWISVKDALPENEKYVLGVIPKRGNLVTEVFYYKGKWGFAEEYINQKETIILDCDVSYWMPLPEPPKQ